MRDVSRDAAPQQLHDGPRAISRIDAGAAELENLAGIGDQPRNVVLGGRIKRAEPRRRVAPDQAVGPDDGLRAAAPAVVEHQEVIADLVIPVAVAAPLLHARERQSAHDLVENPVAQRLGRVDIGGTFRQAHLERAGHDIDDPRGAGVGRQTRRRLAREPRRGRGAGDHARRSHGPGRCV